MKLELKLKLPFYTLCHFSKSIVAVGYRCPKLFLKTLKMFNPSIVVILCDTLGFAQSSSFSFANKWQDFEIIQGDKSHHNFKTWHLQGYFIKSCGICWIEYHNKLCVNIEN